MLTVRLDLLLVLSNAPQSHEYCDRSMWPAPLHRTCLQIVPVQSILLPCRSNQFFSGLLSAAHTNLPMPTRLPMNLPSGSRMRTQRPPVPHVRRFSAPLALERGTHDRLSPLQSDSYEVVGQKSDPSYRHVLNAPFSHTVYVNCRFILGVA
jgi:hypothetical protein